nr:DUF58 domain-containing protein [Pseudomaricurvus alcaniphilus]
MLDQLAVKTRLAEPGWRRLRNSVRRWMLRRLRPVRQLRLSRKNLFIFPSSAGFGYLFVNLLLWLTGTNYENNLILATAFLQTSLFVVCIHHTFFNLTGLTLEVVHTGSCLQGENAELELNLARPSGRGRENIQLGYRRETLLTLDLIEQCSADVKLYVPGLRRGWCPPPRLLVQSSFPLGLIRCWSWVAFDMPMLVYPKPLPGGDLPLASVAQQEGDLIAEQGAEDFFGFRNYVPGMPTRHIAWKQYARGQALYSKEYVTYQGQSLWLDWDALEGLGTEARLSRLCYWVLQLGTVNQPLGLRLPDQELAPELGPEQQQKLLRALALYRWQQAAAEAVE